MMLGRLVIDGVLTKVLQVLANENGQFHALLDIVGKILQPQYSNRFRTSFADEALDGPASSKFEDDRRRIPGIDGHSQVLALPEDALAVNFRLFLGQVLLGVGREDGKRSAFDIEVGSRVRVHFDLNISNFQSACLPSAHILGESRLHTSETETHVELAESLTFSDSPTEARSSSRVSKGRFCPDPTLEYLRAGDAGSFRE